MEKKVPIEKRLRKVKTIAEWHKDYSSHQQMNGLDPITKSRFVTRVLERFNGRIIRKDKFMVTHLNPSDFFLIHENTQPKQEKPLINESEIDTRKTAYEKYVKWAKKEKKVPLERGQFNHQFKKYVHDRWPDSMRFFPAFGPIEYLAIHKNYADHPSNAKTPVVFPNIHELLSDVNRILEAASKVGGKKLNEHDFGAAFGNSLMDNAKPQINLSREAEILFGVKKFNHKHLSWFLANRKGIGMAEIARAESRLGRPITRAGVSFGIKRFNFLISRSRVLREYKTFLKSLDNGEEENKN